MENYPGDQVMFELQAREAWDRRDYSRARQLAGEAMDRALANGQEGAWWGMAFLQAESMREEGDVQAAESAASQLADHPLTVGSPQLSARITTFRSAALRRQGRLGEAITAAETSVRSSTQSGLSGEVLIEAEYALIAALAESGELVGAWNECAVLDRLLQFDVNLQIAGKCYWAMGNVAYMLGNVEEGTRYHSVAAGKLSPTNDLELWAWFNKGSARMRLAAGVVDPATLECIERAEMGTSIVGGKESDLLELELIRAHWQVLTGDFGSALGNLNKICAASSELATQILGEAHLLLGQALQGLQEQEEAAQNLLKSEELFREAGAVDRASYVRTLIDAG